MLRDIETQSERFPGLSDFKTLHMKAGHITNRGQNVYLTQLVRKPKLEKKKRQLHV